MERERAPACDQGWVCVGVCAVFGYIPQRAQTRQHNTTNTRRPTITLVPYKINKYKRKKRSWKSK